MNLVCTERFEEQLKTILEEMIAVDINQARTFKSYLEALIINIPTKVTKYKHSIYYSDEDVKDLEYDGFTIPFLYDEESEGYLILEIIKI